MQHSEDKVGVIDALIEREMDNRIFDLLVIAGEVNPPSVVEHSPRYAGFLGVVRAQGTIVLARIQKNQQIKRLIEQGLRFLRLQNTYVQTGLFVLGVCVSITLLYALVSSIFTRQVNLAVPETYKNMHIESRLLIEKANKDITNRDLFQENIKKAEDLAFQVRDQRLFSTDVNKLLSDISILKRQVSGIESFDMSDKNADYVFKTAGTHLVSLLQGNKRFYFVTGTAVVGPFVKGGELKVYPFPDGEEAVSSDIDGETVYVLTKTNRILAWNKGQFRYVTVAGQRVWQEPGVNGFSTKTEVVSEGDLKHMKISDFLVDGGFYVVKSDLTIDRIFTTPTYLRRSIVLNKLPDGYSIKDNSVPRLFSSDSGYYLYLLLNNHIWVFEPDSKNARDVKGLKYVGQLEPLSGTINTIFVPKDGTVYIGTDKGVYHVDFEVSDGKVIVK